MACIIIVTTRLKTASILLFQIEIKEIKGHMVFFSFIKDFKGGICIYILSLLLIKKRISALFSFKVLLAFSFLLLVCTLEGGGGR